ncbi:MAG: 2-C-methyl-D-erythritol 2,4-cyclodiphosphate synthase [Phycisphaerales bacterium]|nr:MAG: 2-C-methyl-D-erythritol 2,4-cyclodiphosphate synthase [Phycisphaerales bacterium]
MSDIERVGLGYDLHRTDPNRPLILGGVRIESEVGLAGHSDADAVIHAVMDALLGAAGLPDIGELFPDTDPRFEDADSRGLLREVLARLRQHGWEPVNVDVTICAERPRLSPHKPAMAESLAHLLGVERHAVSVKAKTNEGLDAVGRGEAIACYAVAGLCRIA